MPNKVKRMSVREFREKGYLQEVNRRFFHPLGLALEVVVDEATGEERLGGIWDCRDDPQGIIFDVGSMPDRAEKAMFIELEFERRRKTRERTFGFFIQPVQ